MAYLVQSQVRCREVINRRWPARDRGSDGWIADRNHKPPSQHIPDANGAVRAIDVDRDGIHVPTVIAAMLTHEATWYVIHGGRIYRRQDQFRPRTYTGANPHTGHIHRSTLLTAAADRSTAPYPLIERGAGWPTLREGHRGQHVRELQAILDAHGASLHIDGDFGPATTAALRAFQRRHSVPNSVKDGQGDGICGPNTRRSLFTVR